MAATVSLMDEVLSQADSWPTARRVIIMAEALRKGINFRFAGTTRIDHLEVLSARGTDRGETENWIKDRKVTCYAVTSPVIAFCRPSEEKFGSFRGGISGQRGIA
jgi:hypothetical protein